MHPPFPGPPLYHVPIEAFLGFGGPFPYLRHLVLPLCIESVSFPFFPSPPKFTAPCLFPHPFSSPSLFYYVSFFPFFAPIRPPPHLSLILSLGSFPFWATVYYNLLCIISPGVFLTHFPRHGPLSEVHGDTSTKVSPSFGYTLSWTFFCKSLPLLRHGPETSNGSLPLFFSFFISHRAPVFLLFSPLSPCPSMGSVTGVDLFFGSALPWEVGYGSFFCSAILIHLPFDPCSF